MEQEQKCENCKYYRAHYVKQNQGFMSLGTGHCVNSQIIEENRYKRNRYQPRENCEYWESDESKKAERKKTIKEYMIRLAKQIEEIAIILEKDEKGL